MVILSQKDKRWAGTFIGNTKLTVYNYGCTITALSMLSSWYGVYRNPAWMAKNLKFTETGLLYWSSIGQSELNMNFVYRYYTRDDKKIQSIIASRDNACLLQVNNKKHWVLAMSYSRLKGYTIADPIDGKIKLLKDAYPNITGFAEITRK